MAQLRQNYQKFTSRGAEIIAVGPEDAKSFADWWQAHDMPFIGLPDPDHVIARLFSQEVKLLKGGRMPALVVVDREGKIRFKHYADFPGDIPSDNYVLSLLDDLNTVAQPA